MRSTAPYAPPFEVDADVPASRPPAWANRTLGWRDVIDAPESVLGSKGVLVVAGPRSPADVVLALLPEHGPGALVVPTRAAEWQARQQRGLASAVQTSRPPPTSPDVRFLGTASDLWRWRGGGPLVVMDALGFIATIARPGSGGKHALNAAVRACRDNLLVLVATHPDHEMLWELLVAVKCPPEHVCWAAGDVSPGRVLQLCAPQESLADAEPGALAGAERAAGSGGRVGGQGPRAGVTVAAIERVITLVETGERVVVLGSDPTLTGPYGWARAAICRSLPGLHVGYLNRDTRADQIERELTAQLVFADRAAIGCRFGADVHAILIDSPFPSTAADLGRLLDTVIESKTRAIALAGGGGCTALTGQEIAAVHASARQQEQRLAGKVALSAPPVRAHGRGRLREALKASASRGHQVSSLLPRMLRSEGVEVVDHPTRLTECSRTLAAHAAELRTTMRKVEARDILDASPVPPGLDLPRGDVAQRLGTRRSEITYAYGHLAFDPEAGLFRPALVHEPDLGLALVEEHLRRRTVKSAVRCALLDLNFRGEDLAVAQLAGPEIAGDALDATDDVPGVRLIKRLLEACTRAGETPRSHGFAAWMAPRTWRSDDPDLVSRFRAAETGALILEAGALLGRTWSETHGIARVVGDILACVGIRTVSTRGSDDKRTYRADPVSLQNAVTLSAATVARLREQADLVAAVRPGQSAACPSSTPGSAPHGGHRAPTGRGQEPAMASGDARRQRAPATPHALLGGAMDHGLSSPPWASPTDVSTGAPAG